MRSSGRAPKPLAWRRSIAGSVRSRRRQGSTGRSVVVIGASAEVGGLHARVAGELVRTRPRSAISPVSST